MNIADFKVPLVDQALIKGWKNKEKLHLPEIYNCLYGYLDFYINAK